MREVLLIITMVLCGLGCRPFSDAPQAPPREVLGTWEGKTEIFGIHDPEPGRPGERPSAQFTMTIDKRGHVTGHVGGAAFKGCVYRCNRGRLGRALNIKTDHIVCGGYLDGAVCEKDETTHRAFTMPFDLRDNELSGSVMVLDSWKYPDPLTRQLHLERRE